jgi:hydroxyacylglutathione hydrolase
VPQGHTIGDIAFVFPSAHMAFTADSLMAGACGRLFEGSPAMMWASLSKIAALPAQTIICSGHEYTASNLRFAATIEPENADLLDRIARVAAARAAGLPTVPALLSEELATNPFLRVKLPHIKKALGLPTASDAEVFAAMRARKDTF